MATLDNKRLVAEVSAQHGIRLDPDDPMMAVVTLNRLVFEQAIGAVLDKVTSAARDFDQSANKVQIRAGGILAQEVRDAVTAIKSELAQSGSNCAQPKWLLLGAVSGVLLFA